MAERGDGPPGIEVFDPDPTHPRRGGLEPVVRSRRRLPRWVPWVGALAVVALIGAVVSRTSDGEPGDEQADPAAPTSAPEQRATADPDITVDDPWLRMNSFPAMWPTETGGGRAATVVALMDGSRLHIDHPDGVDDELAEVQVSAEVWPFGLEECCRRRIAVAANTFDLVFDGMTPLVELDPGNPRGGTLYGSEVQVLGFGVGDWTVGIVAFPSRPFTATELTLYADLLSLIDRGGEPPVVSSLPPLVVGEAGARVVLDGDPPVSVSAIDRAFGECDDEVDAEGVFMECVLGFMVSGGHPGGPVDAPAPDVDVSVSRGPGPVPSGPAWWSIAGPGERWPPEPVSVRGTRIITGGIQTGVVAGVLETRGGVAWTTGVGDSAFVSPVTVDDTVFVAPVFGTLVALDSYSGRHRWELPLERRQSARPLTVVEMAYPSETLVVVPTWYAEAVRPPVVYGVGAASGRVLWKTELSPEVSPGAWEPVVAGDRIVLSGIAAYDNRDALLVVQAVTVDGELVWSHAVEPSIYTETETPVFAAGTVALVRDGRQAIDALDGTTGELLWRHEADEAIWKVDAGEEIVEIFYLDETSVRLDPLTGDPVT